MGSCYSADHIAEDHIHTDITCNIEEPRQKRHLGTEVIDCVGEGEEGRGTFGPHKEQSGHANPLF